MSESLKEIVVIYHDQCRDGFGSAFAAWKKFGEAATYIPLKTQDKPPEGLVGKELYIVDYSFKKDILDQLAADNDSLVVIDHHLSSEAAVTSFPQNIFDNNHSGAVLTWQYFHPDTPVPTLLLYIEDHDIWKHELPNTREFGAALGEYTMDFETWDTIARNIDTDSDWFSSFISHGGTIAGFEDKFVRDVLRFRELVEFEGHQMYAVNAERIYRSILGHEMAMINESEGRIGMAIVYYRYDGMVHCSLRSNGDVDVAKIAEKYGGGGHKNASSIRVASFADLPFRFLN